MIKAIKGLDLIVVEKGSIKFSKRKFVNTFFCSNSTTVDQGLKHVQLTASTLHVDDALLLLP